MVLLVHSQNCTFLEITFIILFIAVLFASPAPQDPTVTSGKLGVALRRKLCGPEMSTDWDRCYNETGQCYQTGTKGPCGENMLFYGQRGNSVYGICDCDNINYARTLIFHKESNQCYFIFTQAYCQPGEWVTLSKTDGLPTCEPNPCKMVAEVEFVPFNETCTKLDSECGENGEIVTFQPDFILPRCSKKYVPYLGLQFGTLTLLPSRCLPGTYMSWSGKCIRHWHW